MGAIPPGLPVVIGGYHIRKMNASRIDDTAYRLEVTYDPPYGNPCIPPIEREPLPSERGQQ